MTDTAAACSVVSSFGWIGTVTVAVVGGAWAAITYVNGKRIEFQQTFNDKTLETIFLTAETVGNLVSARKEEQWEEQKALFWELYWGRLILFESPETLEAMKALGDELKGTTFKDRWQLHSQAKDVAQSLRNYLKDRNSNDWRITIADISPVAEPGKS
jgi:hypothetical protein